MAEKRAACRVAAQSLSLVVGFDVAPSEVAGTRVTELDTLAAFYKRYEELLVSMDGLWDTHVSEGRSGELPVADLQTLHAKSSALKLLPTYADLTARIRQLTAFREYAVQWSSLAVASDTVAGVAEDLTTDPTLRSLNTFMKGQPQQAASLMAFASAESEARKTVVAAEELLQRPASAFLSDIGSLKECVGELAALMPKTSAGFPGRIFLTTLEKVLGSLRAAKHVADEVALLSAFGGAAVLDADGIAKLHAATVGAEAMRRDAALTVVEFSSTHTSESLDAVTKDVAFIKQRLLALCASARARLPFLSSLPDADVVKYCAISTSHSAEASSFISRLFPWWRRLVFSDNKADVVGIESMSGEQIALAAPVPVFFCAGEEMPLSEVLPAVVDAQRQTVEGLTWAAHTAAHRIAIGNDEFSAELLVAMPSQVALRFLLLLWTELTEGAIGGATQSALSGVSPARPDTSLSSTGFNTSQPSLRRIGTESRGPSRPTSAASGKSARISSPRKSVAEDPRPGSASATLFRKTVKGDEKSKVAQLNAAELFDASLTRPSATSSARTRRIEASSASVLAAAGASPQSPQHAGARLRAQSTIASHARLSGILAMHLALMQQCLTTATLTEAETGKLCALIQWQHRFLSAWDAHVSKASGGDDYLWRREPRMYANSAKQITLQQNDCTVVLDHNFIPLDVHFSLGNADQQAWQHMLLMRSIRRPALFFGHEPSIAAFSSICGRPLLSVFSPSQLPSKNGGASISEGMIAIYSPETLPTSDQDAIARWLAEFDGQNVVIFLRSDATLHPFIKARGSVFVAPPADAMGLRDAVERALLSAGLTETAAATEQLLSFMAFSADIAGWDIPLGLLHASIVTITSALKEGVSLDVALRRSVFGTLLGRAPIAALPSLTRSSRAIFGHAKETLYYPQLSAAMEQALSQHGLVPTTEIESKCKHIYDFLMAPASGILVVRGESRVGKRSLVAAVISLAELMGTRRSSATVWDKDTLAAVGDAVDVVVSLNLPSDVTRLRSAAHKVIALSDDGVLPSRVAADYTVRVLLVDPSAPPHSLLGLSGDEEAAIATVTRLLASHGADIVALAKACDNAATPSRITSTLLSLLKGMLSPLQARGDEEAIERCFWVAATWACVPDANPAWLDFVAARIKPSLAPQPNIFACCVLPSGEWALWTVHAPLVKDSSYNCVPACRSAALIKLLVSGGESVYVTGRHAAAVATAAGIALIEGSAYARADAAGAYFVEALPAYTPLPVVVVPRVLTEADVALLEEPMKEPFGLLAAASSDGLQQCCSLGALAMARQILARGDLKGDASSCVAMLARLQSPLVSYPAISALVWGTEGAGATEESFAAMLSALLRTSSPSFCLVAQAGCSDVVAAALTTAAASAVFIKTVDSVPLASPVGYVAVYRPTALPPLGSIASALALGSVLVDLSGVAVPENVKESLLGIGMVVQYAFTAESQQCLLEASGAPASLAAALGQIPAGAVVPTVFQSALGLARRISGDGATAGVGAAARARGAVRAFKALEQRIAKKPLFSQAEADYKGPDGGAESMRLFEGRAVYKDYPAEALRLMMHPRHDEKGVFKEFTHVSACIGTPQCDVVSLTATEGGQCRARQESGGVVIVSAAPYEMRLTATEEGGYSGTLSEVGRGTALLGTVELSPASGSATMRWLRGLEEEVEEAPEEREEGAEDSQGGSAAQEREDRDKAQSAANSALRTALRMADGALRESFASASAADHTAAAAAVLVVASAMSVRDRASFTDASQTAYAAAAGSALPDPWGRDVAALVTGQSPAALSLWIASQQAAGLPAGAHGEQVAVAVRVLRAVGIEPSLSDPTGLFGAWASSVGLRVAGGASEASGAVVCADHTVASLAAVLSGAAPKVDVSALSTAAEIDAQNRAAVAALLAEAGDLEGDALFDYLTGAPAQEMLSKVAVVPDAAPPAPPKKGGKAAAEKESASAPFRIAALVVHAARLLPQIQPLYAVPMVDLIALASASLQAPAKGTQSAADVAVRAFGAQLLAGVLQEDRLLLSAGLAMAVLVEEGRADPSAFGLVLRMLRNADPSAIEGSNAAMLEAATVAFADWQRAQEASKTTRRKEAKELRDFVDPKMMPSYPFMGEQQWANVLCLAEAVPSLAGLPQALQHGDLPKGATRQDKWAEWLEACIGPLPTYEKAGAVSPLDQLLVILALRPSKLVVALLQFVVETLGADFPDPYALDDPIPLLVQTARASRRALVVHSPLAAPQAIQQTIVAAAKASATAVAPASPASPGKASPAAEGAAAKPRAPCVFVESALFPQRVAEAIASACASNDWVVVEDCEKVTPQMMESLLAAAVPQSFTGTVFYSAAPSPSISAKAFANVPRVTCNFVWSLRRSMTHHYATLKSQNVPLTHANHRLVFVATFLISALEQRSRFGNLGFTSAERFYACERDVAATISAVLRATAHISAPPPKSADSPLNASNGRTISPSRGSPSSDSLQPIGGGWGIPWDSLRDQLFVILAALASTARDSAIVQAYIDWLIHPQVVLGDAELGNGVVIPSSPSLDVHFATIAQLPDTTSTEMIGLNTAVELRQRELESERVFTFLEDSFAPIPTREEVEAFAQQVRSALPSPPPLLIAGALVEAAAAETAVPTALCKEWDSFKAFVGSIQRDLAAVHTKSDRWRTAFAQQRVPSEWERPDEPHGSIQVFVGSLQSVSAQLVEWSHNGLPRALAVSAFADAKGFITACRHDAAVQMGLPLSRIAATFEVLQDASEVSAAVVSPSAPMADGLVFVALQMVGALVDRKGMLQELFEHAIHWWQMPSTEVGGVRVTFGLSDEDINANRPKSKPLFSPSRPSTAFHSSTARTPPSSRVLQQRRTSVSRRGVYAAPLYATASQRAEDLVGYVPVECFEDHNYWILRGAAVVGGV